MPNATAHSTGELPNAAEALRHRDFPASVFSVSRWLHSERGFTFIELVIVTSILIVLASMAMPLAQVTAQRQREAELRRSLRELRTAIDRFKESVDNGL